MLECWQHQNKSSENHFKLEKMERKDKVKRLCENLHRLHLFFKPDASSCWHLYQLQLSEGEILLQGIKNFNLSRVVVTKVVLSFYFVCLT